jgi:hypothetical protein
MMKKKKKKRKKKKKKNVFIIPNIPLAYKGQILGFRV